MNTQIDPFVIPFGKYKGRFITEITNDLSYCKWLSTQPFTSDEIKEYITSNINVDDYIMRWGKYKNKSLSWIHEVDEKYIEWLENNDFVKTKCPKLLQAIISLRSVQQV